MLIEMKVKNLAFDLAKSGAMVFLEEMNGKRVLPIWIGIFEANAIALELRKINTARPMTHDLILNIIKGLEAEVTKIVVTELRDNTFYAAIHIHAKERKAVIDSRPRDAIAVALRVLTMPSVKFPEASCKEYFAPGLKLPAASRRESSILTVVLFILIAR